MQQNANGTEGADEKNSNSRPAANEGNAYRPAANENQKNSEQNKESNFNVLSGIIERHEMISNRIRSRNNR